MKVSSTFSIDIDLLLMFNQALQNNNLKRSKVINQLIQEWIEENKNGVLKSNESDSKWFKNKEFKQLRNLSCSNKNLWNFPSIKWYNK